MSRTVQFEAPVCDYCGCHIIDDGQDCPARDDSGRPPLITREARDRSAGRATLPSNRRLRRR